MCRNVCVHCAIIVYSAIEYFVGSQNADEDDGDGIEKASTATVPTTPATATATVLH